MYESIQNNAEEIIIELEIKPSEFIINYAYVITQGICNKFIEMNFCVGCIVSRPNHL